MRRGLAVQTAGLLAALWTSEAAAQVGDFVKRSDARLQVGSREFRFAGANNYYLSYASTVMVDAVLNQAVEQRFTVLRTWAAIDIGERDGSNSTSGKQDGRYYFQYWDGKSPVYNEGPDGLARLDYLVYRAGELGLRLILPLVNNWQEFGGMDQYVRWRGGQFHDDFYTDPQIRRWYMAWLRYLVNRTNIYTGLRYRDDPTILAWELANEPRCRGSGVYPTSPQCTTQTLTRWAQEMSAFLERLDPNHLVSVGDEGFYCIAGSDDLTENCSEGVDTLALTALPSVDVMSFHLYPEAWGRDLEWSRAWIERHLADALALGKPAILGEFGIRDASIRNVVYREWTQTFFDLGGAGALFWMLAGPQDNGAPYPDYDGFTVYCPSPVCETLSHFGWMMLRDAELSFPPVADDDVAVVPYGSGAAWFVTRNDVAFGATIIPASVDLDPTTAVQDTVFLSEGGSFAASPDGLVRYSPADGFVGTAEATYLVRDGLGRASNVARIRVTVQPAPDTTRLLHSFEAGTERWAAPSWDAAAGTTSVSQDYATLGNSSLRIDVAPGSAGQWFGLAYGAPADFDGGTHLAWDMTALAGTATRLAVQLGGTWTWCESGEGWLPVGANTSSTIRVDLRRLSCGLSELSEVHALYVFLGNEGGGTFHIDNVRLE